MENKRKKQKESIVIVDKPTYRAAEAAEYLSIGLSTVWHFVKQGKLTPIKISDRVTIFKKEDLDRFISEGEEYVH